MSKMFFLISWLFKVWLIIVVIVNVLYVVFKIGIFRWFVNCVIFLDVLNLFVIKMVVLFFKVSFCIFWWLLIIIKDLGVIYCVIVVFVIVLIINLLRILFRLELLFNIFFLIIWIILLNVNFLICFFNFCLICIVLICWMVEISLIFFVFLMVWYVVFLLIFKFLVMFWIEIWLLIGKFLICFKIWLCFVVIIFF